MFVFRSMQRNHGSGVSSQPKGAGFRVDIFGKSLKNSAYLFYPGFYLHHVLLFVGSLQLASRHFPNIDIWSEYFKGL
jgi:hypothetical protein